MQKKPIPQHKQLAETGKCPTCKTPPIAKKCGGMVGKKKK